MCNGLMIAPLLAAENHYGFDRPFTKARQLRFCSLRLAVVGNPPKIMVLRHPFHTLLSPHFSRRPMPPTATGGVWQLRLKGFAERFADTPMARRYRIGVRDAETCSAEGCRRPMIMVSRGSACWMRSHDSSANGSQENGSSRGSPCLA